MPRTGPVELPHWSDPPTGEVPEALVERGRRPRRLVVVRRRAHPAGATATATGTTSRSTRCSPPTSRLAGRRHGRLPSDATTRCTRLRRARRRGGGPAQRLRPRPEHRVRARVVRGGRGRGARRRRSPLAAARRPAATRWPSTPAAPPATPRRAVCLAAATCAVRRSSGASGFAVRRRRRLHARPGGHDGRGRRHPHGLRLRVLQRGPPGRVPAGHPARHRRHPAGAARRVLEGHRGLPAADRAHGHGRPGWHLVGADGDARVVESVGRHPARGRLDRRARLVRRAHARAVPTASASCSRRWSRPSPTTWGRSRSAAAPAPVRSPTPARTRPIEGLVGGVVGCARGHRHPRRRRSASPRSTRSATRPDRPRRRHRRAARRPVRVAGQARPRRQGHGRHPPGPRRLPRPLRRAALRAAAVFYAAVCSLDARPVRRRSTTTVAARRLDRLDRHPDPRRRRRRARPVPDRRPRRQRPRRRRCSSRRPRPLAPGGRRGGRRHPASTSSRRRCPACEVRAGDGGPGQPGRRGRRVRQRRRRLRRPARHPRHAGRRAAPGPGQQGVADRRRAGGAAGAGARPAPSWCRSTASTARSTSACGAGGRPARPGGRGSCSPPAAARSGAARRAELADGHRRRRPGPPDLDDGPEDHRRLVDPDEQGPRGDRGPRAVRRRATTASRWSSTRSRSCTRWSSSPTGPPSPSCRMPDMRLPIGYALAWPDRLGHPLRAHRLGRARPPRLRAARPRGLPLPRPGLRGRADRRHRPRPGSTRPTRWRWPPSSTGRIRWIDIPDVLEGVLARHDGGRAATRRRHRRGRLAGLARPPAGRSPTAERSPVDHHRAATARHRALRPPLGRHGDRPDDRDRQWRRALLVVGSDRPAHRQLGVWALVVAGSASSCRSPSTSSATSWRPSGPG